MTDFEKEPSFLAEVIDISERMPIMSTSLTIMQLGEGSNPDGIGPDKLHIDTEGVTKLAEDISSPEYRRTPVDVYGCIDGRSMILNSVVAKILDGLNDGEWLTQVAGSKALQDTSVQLMLKEMVSDHPSEPRLSKLLATKTQEAIANEYTVIVHGDDHKHEEGCGANANQRDSLKKNMENVEIVSPFVFSLGSGSYSRFVPQEEISNMIMIGAKNAGDDLLWDVTPAQKTKIMIDNGAVYVELEGPHLEAGAAVVLDENETVHGDEFRKDHQLEDGLEAQIFVATHGKAMADIAKDGVKAGKDEHQIAREQAAATLWLVGVSKKLTNQHMRLIVLNTLAAK